MCIMLPLRLQADDLEAIGDALVIAAGSLLYRWANNVDDTDAKSAITFVLAPRCCEDDLLSFINLCEALEDLLFTTTVDAALARYGAADGAHEDAADHGSGKCVRLVPSTLGDTLLFAGFHPKWQFGGESEESPMNYEKRSPVPTFSLVMAEGVEGGEEATLRIGEQNDQTLHHVGEERLRHLFKSLAD